MQISLAVRVEKAKLDSVIAAIPGATEYATELAADGVVSRAKAIVPVDTGALQKSITKIGGGGSWVVTAETHYAGFVEWGTRFMAAQPYLRPALEGLRWTDILSAFFRRIGL